MLLNSTAHGQTTVLSPGDVVKFYDAGGRNDRYHDHNSDFTHTFQAQQGNVRVKFVADKDETTIRSEDTLYIYDSDHADENRILAKVSYLDDADDYEMLSFVSTGHYLTFRFQQNGSSSDDGWNTTIMPVNPLADADTAKVYVNITTVPPTAITAHPDTVCLSQRAVVSASADIQFPQYYVWYNNNMEVLKYDTLHTPSTESVLELPEHYSDASYYAYVYSDTVSCVMNLNNLPKIYREFYITPETGEGELFVGQKDSVYFYSSDAFLNSAWGSSYYVYHIYAESGLIQIHFDNLSLLNDAGLYFANAFDDSQVFNYISEGEYHDVTVTSLNKDLYVILDRDGSSSRAQIQAVITNINGVNDNVLSKMTQVDVVIRGGSTAKPNITTTNDTVCVGNPALLTASAPSSEVGFPQTYTWYDENLSKVLFQETIQSGVSRYYIPGQVGDATYYVAVSNDTICPLVLVDNHENFREYLYNEDLNNKTLFVESLDSLVIYDDGGKDGDYSVPQNDAVVPIILTLETYAGATLDISIPKFEAEMDDEVGLYIVECDDNGNLVLSDEYVVTNLYESLTSEFRYTSRSNKLYLGWVCEPYTDPYSGFEIVVKSITINESMVTPAHVVMKGILPFNTNVLTASPLAATICQGDTVDLSATSSLADQPQYFIWHNSDLSTVLAADTVSGNVGHASIAGIMQDTLIYVSVGTNDICPAYPLHNKINVQSIYLTESISGNTVYLSPLDSVLFYDEGGPDRNYTSEHVMWYQTFKAINPGAHVVVHFTDINLDTKNSNNWIAVAEGPLDLINLSNNTLLHTPFEGTHSDVTLVSTGDNLTIAWNSTYRDQNRRGWSAEVFTDEEVNTSIDALSSTFVTVNPSYQFDLYDTVIASATPYDVDRFLGIDISNSGEYMIDSVYHTVLGCDSIYTLYLTVLSSTVKDITIASHSNSWTYDGWIHSEKVYTVVYGTDTLTADAGSDGKVFTMPVSGDVLTITPDATAEVVYYTPTPVPNSFSYTLDNEANYTSVTTDTGTLTIVPIPTEITITANSASKFYDGTPLTNDGYSYTPDDILVDGDTLVVEIVGSIIELGDSLNRVASYHVYRDENFNRRGIASYTKDVTDCYTFSLPVSGILSVVDTLKVSSVVTSGKMCPGENDGAATITVVGGKEKTPNRYEYSIEGSNTGYSNTGHTEGEILLSSLSVDEYIVTVTDDLGFTATDTFNIVERPVITATTLFDCPTNIDTVLKHGGCNLMLLDIGTPNFVAPTGMDMADVTIYNNAPADHIYEVGETTVTWVAKGMCGDSITCDQIIKVSFQTCPDAIDFEDTIYHSVRLGRGCKCWTTRNLVSTKYSDGRVIDNVMDYQSHEYPNISANVEIFGHLYNWYAAADTARYGSVDSVERAYESGQHIQGICPDGWYLPSDEEYEELNIYPTTDLRSTNYWIRVNGVVNTNLTGFNSLPGGMYNCATGRFEDMMGESYYWTCHPVYDMATGAMIDYICEKIITHNNSRCNGYSIRCIWDEH